MLGEQLVTEGLLRREALAQAEAHRDATGIELVEALLTLSLVAERDLLRVLAQHHQLQYLTTEKISALKVPDELLDQVNVRVAESNALMPIRQNQDGTLWVLASAPLPPDAVNHLKNEGGAKRVNVILARPSTVRASIRRHYYRDPDAFLSVGTSRPQLADSPTPVPTLSHDKGRTDPFLPMIVAPGEVTSPGRRLDQIEADAAAHGGEITRRVRLALNEQQQALERENQRLRVAQSLIPTVLQIHRVEDLVREVALAMMDLFPAEGVAVVLNGVEPGLPEVTETLRRDRGTAPFAISSTVLNVALTARQAVGCPNLAGDPRLNGEAALIARGIKSLLVAPLRVRERTVGALYVESKDLAAFTGDAAERLDVVAYVASLAIDTLSLMMRLERQARTGTSYERFLSAPRALAASTNAQPFDLKPRQLDGTFVCVRPVPSVRARIGEGIPQLFGRLESHLEVVTSRLHAHGGVVESVSRGEVCALFSEGPEHADSAISASVEILKLAAAEGRALPVAIGVASGTLVAGGAGKAGQLQYAVLGEPTELARSLAAAAPATELHGSDGAQRSSGRFHSWQALGSGAVLGGEARPAFRLLWR